MVNWLLFPAPSPPYYNRSLPELVWMPPTPEAKSATASPSSCAECVPALFVPSPSNSPCGLLIYLHGNGTDVGAVTPWAHEVASRLKMHVLCPEYPGYGVHPVRKASESGCNDAAAAAYAFAVDTLGVSPKRVVIHGRSIGSGPATELAARLHSRGTPAAGLILQSPFLSIKSLAKTILGPAGIAANLITNRFNNLARITDTGETPLLVMHGRQDALIPHQHGEVLHARSQAAKKYIHVLDGVDHNNFSVAHTVGPSGAFLAFVGLHPDRTLGGLAPPRGERPPAAGVQGDLNEEDEGTRGPMAFCGASGVLGRASRIISATFATSVGVTAGLLESGRRPADAPRVDARHPFQEPVNRADWLPGGLANDGGSSWCGSVINHRLWPSSSTVTSAGVPG